MFKVQDYGLNIGLSKLKLEETIGTSTNVGRHKGRTVQRSDLLTSDQYKRRTSTNVGLVQTLDQYKRRTSTNVGLTNVGLVQTSDKYKRSIKLVQMSDQYKRRTGTFIRKNVGLGRF